MRRQGVECNKKLKWIEINHSLFVTHSGIEQKISNQDLFSPAEFEISPWNSRS